MEGSPSASDPLSGQAFGKYVLLKRLAVGGMAEVYLANLHGAAGFSKLVVMKLVLPSYASDEKFIELFLDEGRLAARLSHPNIAQTFDLGEADGRYYMAMEYVMGETLSAVLRRARDGRPVPLSSALRVGAQLLEALDYAHDATDDRGVPLGVVHRDVSPSNVLVTYHGGVKLVDFGIARAATQRHETQVGVVRGKLGFMAPEQCTLAQVDRRADIFAAGAILYTLVTGQEPYPRFTVFQEALAAMREARFPAPRQVNPQVPEPLEALLLRAMMREPNERYQTAGAMLTDLERFAASVTPPPNARELGDYVRTLFPDKAKLAQIEDDVSDPKTLVELLSVSEADILRLDTDTFDNAATRPLRAPSPQALLGSRPAGHIAEGERTTASAQMSPQARRPPARLWWGLVGAGAVFGAAGLVWSLGRTAPPQAPGPLPVSVAAVPVPVTPPQPRAEEPVDVASVMPSPSPTPAPRPKVSTVRGATHPAARPTGWLKIDTYPWSRVRDGAVELGSTPLRAELPAGRHHIVLENDQLHLKRTVWITIRAGEETPYSAGLDKLPP